MASEQHPQATIHQPIGRTDAKADLSQSKHDRKAFKLLPRRPVSVVLDGVRGARKLGAIFQLCDGYLVDRLVICGPKVDVGKRKVRKAAHGAQAWVPWDRAKGAAVVVADIKAAGAWVVVADPNGAGSSLDQLTPVLPACLVLGSDKRGVSQEVLDLADAVVSLPMLGIAKSLNVVSTAAIILHWLSGPVSSELKPSQTQD